MYSHVGWNAALHVKSAATVENVGFDSHIRSNRILHIPVLLGGGVTWYQQWFRGHASGNFES